MNPPTKLSWTIGIGLLLLIFTLVQVFVLAQLKSIKTRTSSSLPVLGQVGDFNLTNQKGEPVTVADLRGRVWVADIIFTTCAGPCLRMSRQMKELETGLPAGSEAKLVSLTTNPDYDTPKVLAEYAARLGADTNRWMFLTGPKERLLSLAVNGLKLSAVENAPADRTSPEDLFIHSTMFVVVDKQARLRGVFQTEDADWPVEKGRILAAIQQLEREK